MVTKGSRHRPGCRGSCRRSRVTTEYIVLCCDGDDLLPALKQCRRKVTAVPDEVTQAAVGRVTEVARHRVAVA